jgi:O-antigen polymerase
MKHTFTQKNNNGIHWVLAIVCLWLIFLFPLFLPNRGGVGLNLPQNLITWSVMMLIGSIIFITQARHKSLIVPPSFFVLTLSLIVLAVPLLYTRHEWVEQALWRHAGLLCGFMFWFAMLQCKWTHKQRQWMLYVILLSMLIQGVLALVQMIYPAVVAACLSYPLKNGHPTGVFQQSNVLASFIASGLGLTLGLFLSPAYLFSRFEKVRQSILATLTILFIVVLVLQQSRIGIIGAAIVCLWSWVTSCRRHPLKTLISLLLVISGVLIGWYMLKSGHVISVRDSSTSTLARYHMYKSTLDMVVDNPVFGWGYGGYEFAFQHFRIIQLPPVVDTGIARHPHNEILYWLVEGGIVAGAGLVIFGIGVFRIGLSTWRKRLPQGLHLPVCLAITPILLHTQTEYPFYASAALFSITLILLAMLTAPCSRKVSVTPRISSRLVFQEGLLIISLFMLCIPAIMLPAVRSEIALTRYEQDDLLMPAPAADAMRYDRLINIQRWNYDLHTAELLKFNDSRDVNILKDYEKWATDYSSSRLDANVYYSLIKIACFNKDYARARRLTSDAILLFNGDARFNFQLVPFGSSTGNHG